MTVVPESVGKFTALRTLNLSDCWELTALPESVGNLGALQTLDLSDCWKLKTLPASISQLTQLDEASREHVSAIERGALTALPCAGEYMCLSRHMRRTVQGSFRGRSRPFMGRSGVVQGPFGLLDESADEEWSTCSEDESAEEEESTGSEGESADGSHGTLRDDGLCMICECRSV
jgi:hypothetical protein